MLRMDPKLRVAEPDRVIMKEWKSDYTGRLSSKLTREDQIGAKSFFWNTTGRACVSFAVLAIVLVAGKCSILLTVFMPKPKGVGKKSEQ
jgi:hypothetical protein